MRIALAVNPTSGQGRGRQAGVEAAAALRRAGVEVAELAGKDADDLRGQVRTELAAGVDALVVVGGDGMVHLGVNLVAEPAMGAGGGVGRRVPLGIIAAGTGNDVARALGLPVRRPAEAAEAVVAGLDAPGVHRRRIDAVRCTTGGGEVSWFAGVLGAGFDALVNERANGWDRPRGRTKYVLAVLRELPVFRPREYVLELDGKVTRTRAMLVAVANGPSYGGGMRVAPDARLDDGLLDVMLVTPISRARFLTVFPRVFAGTHVANPAVVIERAARVTVQAEGIVGYADGERIAALPLTCECVPGAVEVLAPRAGAGPAE